MEYNKPKHIVSSKMAKMEWISFKIYFHIFDASKTTQLTHKKLKIYVCLMRAPTQDLIICCFWCSVRMLRLTQTQQKERTNEPE